MLPAIVYLDFAHRWYGRVAYDLASSGIAAAGADALGGAAEVDDFAARGRFSEALASRYRVPASEIVPCQGASGALFVAHATLLERGSRLLVENPGYEPLWRGAEVVGAAVDRFERRFEAGFALEAESVLAALRPETRLVAITNPHNPTGAVASDEEITRLAAALAEHDVKLLVDEAYLELARPRSTARRLGPNVVTCSSATKCWGIGWSRAGWLVLPAELAEAAARVERYVNGQAPPICWAWGERAVARADRLLSRAHTLQQGKRGMVDRFVAAAAGTLAWCAPPESGLFGWLKDLRGGDTEPRIVRGAHELGVVVAPGGYFGDASALRLGWTGPADKLGEGLKRLARALEIPEAELALSKNRGGA